MLCEIQISVSFTQHTLIKKDFGVVEGDYNTTKLVFDFAEDVSNKRILFNMSNPHGELVMSQELSNNEIVLVGFDDEGSVYSLFNAPGLYPFELVAYGENSKLTSATGWLNVSKRQVGTGEGGTHEGYLPIVDEILSGIGRGIVDITLEEVK